MKKLMPWIKSNLFIVLCLFVALVAVPIMIFFSAGMNKSLRERLNNEVSGVMKDLSSISVNYEVPSLDPSEQAISVRAIPNDATTEAVARRLEELSALSDEARERVVNRNRAGKAVLVEGLFPKPADESARVRLTAEMVRAWPEAHKKLLEKAHAGSPPDPGSVLRILEQRKAREVDKIESNRAEKVTDEELAKIEQDLIEARLETYRSAAKRASFYADTTAFTKLIEVPEPDNLPKLDEYQRLFWDWQNALWVHQDVVSAIERANTGPTGWLTVVDAPVKRLLKVAVDPLPAEKVKTGSLAQTLERNFKVSPTGRAGGNPLYDRRTARVEMIVDAASVNTVISAFSTTDFMGVTNVEATWHDAAPDLRTGFDYGDRSVMHLTLDVETIWIRSWIEPLLPPDVRADMGLPTSDNNTNNDAADSGF